MCCLHASPASPAWAGYEAAVTQELCWGADFQSDVTLLSGDLGLATGWGAALLPGSLIRW